MSARIGDLVEDDLELEHAVPGGAWWTMLALVRGAFTQ